MLGQLGLRGRKLGYCRGLPREGPFELGFRCPAQLLRVSDPVIELCDADIVLSDDADQG